MSKEETNIYSKQSKLLVFNEFSFQIDIYFFYKNTKVLKIKSRKAKDSRITI